MTSIIYAQINNAPPTTPPKTEDKEVQKRLDAALKGLDALKNPGRRAPDIKISFAGIETGSGFLFATVGSDGLFTPPAILLRNDGGTRTEGNLSVRLKFS